MHLQLWHAATVSWQKGRKHVPPTTTAVGMPGKSCKRRSRRENPKTTGRMFPSTFIKLQLSFVAALRGKADQVHQEVAASTREPEPPKTKLKQQEPDQSVPAPTVNSDIPDMLRALTVVQQMTELKGAVSEEAMIYAITKIVINLLKENGK
jgi:hypothetical protein